MRFRHGKLAIFLEFYSIFSTFFFSDKLFFQIVKYLVHIKFNYYPEIFQ